MGPKIMWGGLTAIVALAHFFPIALTVGAIIMPIGYVLYVLDK
jgi:hypothetical protein